MTKYPSIIFRLKEEEKQLIKQAAKEKSLSLSSFVRFYAVEKAKQIIQPEDVV